LLREIVVDQIPPASQRASELGVSNRLPPGFDAWFGRCVSRDIDARFPEAGMATRAFAELVPRDAPRGVLAAAISPATGATASDLGVAQTVTATEALTGPTNTASSTASATSSSTATAPAPRSKLPIAAAMVGVLALMGGGIALFLNRAVPSSQPAAQPQPSAVASAAPAPAAASAAMPKERCPAGMVFIEGGNMFMGTRSGEGNASPAHRVTVTSFCLDKTEVTTEAYDICAQAGNCLRSLQDVNFPGVKDEQVVVFSKLCNTGRPEQKQHPINCIDWSMAANYCAIAGGRLNEGGARLPTEAEWEFAARGSGQRVYPWGDEPPDPSRLNGCGTECKKWMVEHRQSTDVMYPGDDGYPATAPVGSYPAGASQAGILDLAGNVWEWTADWYGDYTEAALVDPKGPETGLERVVRGGAFNGFMADWAKPSYRWKTTPTTYNHAIGFRCAKTPESP
jgi:formylglycine-generating enzyme required for sulfatase activity